MGMQSPTSPGGWHCPHTCVTPKDPHCPLCALIPHTNIFFFSPTSKLPGAEKILYKKKKTNPTNPSMRIHLQGITDTVFPAWHMQAENKH